MLDSNFDKQGQPLVTNPSNDGDAANANISEFGKLISENGECEDMQNLEGDFYGTNNKRDAQGNRRTRKSEIRDAVS